MDAIAEVGSVRLRGNKPHLKCVPVTLRGQLVSHMWICMDAYDYHGFGTTPKDAFMMYYVMKYCPQVVSANTH